MTSQIYFDCNATTPTLPEAARAALITMEAGFGNPSSVHVSGLQAKHQLERARTYASDAVGAGDPSTIVFTSGATEAIQTAVLSALSHIAKRMRAGEDLTNAVVLYGATEHKAVPQALYHWREILGLPLSIESLPVDGNGQHDLAFLAERMPRCVFLATMAVNNETGVVTDIEGIGALVETHGAKCLWLVDCVQALGKRPLALASSRIDYAPFSGHKLYAPKGIGFLYSRKGSPLTPLIVGGGQERGARSGTENLPGVVAFGEVLRMLVEGACPFACTETLSARRESIVDTLRECFPGVVFNMPFEHSVPTTVNFSVPGFSSREIMDLFDAAGVRLSAGSACGAAKSVRSYVLDAMGIPEWRSLSAIRLSFGPATTGDEITRGLRAISQAARALRESCALAGPGPADTLGMSAPSGVRSEGVVQFASGAANTWIVVDALGGTAVVIDPCEETAARVVHFLQCQGLRTLAVLDTHLHADHDSPRKGLEELLDVQVPRDDLGFPNIGVQTETLDGKSVSVLALSPRRSLVRIATPGHTSESVSFLLREDGAIRFLFCGDLLLAGGLGRTNFASSDAGSMLESLRMLGRLLPARCVLCCAHDYSNSFATIWQSERLTNPLLELALDDSNAFSRAMFLAAKVEYDAGLRGAEAEAQGIVCGVVSKDDGEGCVSIAPGCFREFLSRNGSLTRVVDVREPWEWNVSEAYEGLGLDALPENIPLSRFANLIADLLSGKDAFETPVALFCRSGSRSIYVARSLRRLGFVNAWSLEGGLAYGLS